MRIRNVAVGNGLMVLCATGFFAYTLCNVLFLTSVWHYSVLRAGLAITPGPFVAAAVARPTSELAERIGHRVVVAAGAVLWAAGLVWFLTRVGARPSFLAEWLPGMLILGLGAGIAFPNVSSVAVVSAPGERFATATAVNSVARQLGAVLGVAVLVAIIGTAAHGLRAFRGGWWLGVGCFGAMAIGALALGRIAATSSAAAEGEPAPEAAATTQARAPVAGWVPPAPRRPVRSSGSPAEFLRGAPLFSELPSAALDSIVERAAGVRVGAGEWLFRQGDPGDSLYIVRSGRLAAIREDQGGRTVATIERGSVVGELAVLARSTRAASIRALRDCELLRVTSADFTDLMAASAPFASALAGTLSAQVQAGSGPPPARRPLPATIALVPLEDAVPIDDIAHALRETLARWGPAVDLRAVQPAPTGDPLVTFGPQVDECEAHEDHVLLVAERPDVADPWTEFCLARADRILAITTGLPVPEWAAGRAALHGCELAGYGAPSGALSPWIAALEPDAIHRLDPGAGLVASAALTARRLAGRSVGVVLSGGGARAFAHLGVLEELIGAGVTIDRVGGVSMGAFIGAQLAAGRDVAEIDAHCYEEWVRRNPINDYTLPRRALIRGQKGAAMVRRVFGDLRIEELPRPFYCASTDLRRGELALHRHGELAEAILATISLPILAPPRMLDGRALIDGSLLDNLPIAPMAATGEGPVIAVDVKPRRTRTPGERRRSKSGPPLGETIARVLQLATTDTAEATDRHADVVIRAGVEGVGLLEFHQIDVARKAGRHAARMALERGLI